MKQFDTGDSIEKGEGPIRDLPPILPQRVDGEEYAYVTYGIFGSYETPAELRQSMEIMTKEEWERARYLETLSLWLYGETFIATED